MDKKTVLDKLRQLPVIPQVGRAVMDSFKDQNAGSAALAHTIANDQGLSAKVLRVANSSFYGLSRKVGSIQDAVTVLGFDTVRSLVISAGVTRAFPATADDLFDRHAYWIRSIRVAIYTEALAQFHGSARRIAFTSGLFHDVGQLVLSICIPEKFAEVLVRRRVTGGSLAEIERSILGFDHAEIGAEMAKHWSFPLEIEHAIHFWRIPERGGYEPILGLVYVAVLLETGLIGDELITRIPASLRERLELNWDEVEQCLPETEELDAVARLMLEE